MKIGSYFVFYFCADDCIETDFMRKLSKLPINEYRSFFFLLLFIYVMYRHYHMCKANNY